MNIRKLGVFAMLVGALALGVADKAAAQNKITLKLGFIGSDNPQQPAAIAALLFKQALERQSGGRIQVQLFPNGQLGEEKAMLEGLRFGTVDAALITNATIAQIEPAFQLNDLPFLYSTEAQAHKVLDGKVGQTLAKKLEPKGLVTLGFMEMGFRVMVNNTRPVNRPTDVKGVKYRVMQSPLYIDMFSALGGSAVPMAWGEVFPAVQQGTIDGLEMPVVSVHAMKFDELVKYVSLTNHTYSMVALLVSQKAFDKLPPDLKAVVREAGRSIVGPQRFATAANVKDAVGVLEKKGVKVNVVTDIASFRPLMKPVYDKYRPLIGADLMDQALGAVKQ